MAVICDVNEYRKCVATFKIPQINSLFDTLHTLCKLLQVSPENLKMVCSGDQLVSYFFIPLYVITVSEITDHWTVFYHCAPGNASNPETVAFFATLITLVIINVLNHHSLPWQTLSHNFSRVAWTALFWWTSFSFARITRLPNLETSWSRNILNKVLFMYMNWNCSNPFSAAINKV